MPAAFASQLRNSGIFAGVAVTQNDGLSFIYDGRKPGDDPWAKLEPLGLMWGNDPFLSDADAATGAKPIESMSSL